MGLIKRGFDILFSLAILLTVSPIFIIAALGIRASSSGPVFYRARRVGIRAKEFDMFKFRSMHIGVGGPVITSQNDTRVFRFGTWLRKLKVDELPQFVNVLKGEMSIVGPRPEDPKIVNANYTEWMMETLNVRPGITSPGAIFYYAWGEKLIDSADPERSYIERLLPLKIAVERAYLERAGLTTDLIVIAHTAVAILGEAVGQPVKPNQRDLAGAGQWVEPSAFEALE